MATLWSSLLHRLRRGPDRASTASQAVNLGASDGVAEQDLYALLAPPRGAGEVGWLGPYRVLEMLGAGGMGVVFRAEDPQLARPVALKAMLPRLASSSVARQRFLREAKAAAAVKHDHIVTIHQVGEDRGVPYLAMELLEGESLEKRLQRQPIQAIGEVLRIGREIAEGLGAAHERGLIHRDIKPGNLWLEGKRARVELLDFGLARAADESGHLTSAGAILGTPGYMAPEQARGKEVDGRCDLFSLGCVLYRMSTGRASFSGVDTMAVLMALANDDPPPPMTVNHGVPAALSDLIMRMLAKQPQARPASAAAVAAALESLARHDAIAPTQSLPSGPAAEAGQLTGPSAAAPLQRDRRLVRTLSVAGMGCGLTMKWLITIASLVLLLAVGAAFVLNPPGPKKDASAPPIKLTAQSPEVQQLLKRADGLRAQNQIDDAIAAYTEAIKLVPTLADAHGQLSWLWQQQGQWEKATAAARKAIELNPNTGWYYSAYARGLEELGRLDEALAGYRKAKQLSNDDWTTAHLTQIEALVALVPRLDEVQKEEAQKGERKPIDAGERVQLARLAQRRTQWLLASRLYERAFTDKPDLAEDLNAANRYEAAGCAVMAAAGAGVHAVGLAGEERAQWRDKALRWLRADLLLRDKRAALGGAKDRQAVFRALYFWQHDPNLASVREPTAIVKLPPGDPEAWGRLWADVAQVLKKVETPRLQ
jgi:serine/threonine protein kinase